MEQNIQDTQSSQVIFQEMIKKAYELGLTEEKLTVRRLLDEIMGDLRNLISR